LYDPGTGTFVATGNLTDGRYAHTATLLQDGRVLIVGGAGFGNVINGLTADTAELYDPATGKFTCVGGASLSGHCNLSMTINRAYHTATLLEDGRVLIAGGIEDVSSDFVPLLDTAELYNPSTNTFSCVGSAISTFPFCSSSMTDRRAFHTATHLQSGDVLLAAGEDAPFGISNTAEFYHPPSGAFNCVGSVSATPPRCKPSMTNGREGHTATLLQNGDALITGGVTHDSGSFSWLDTAELYDPRTRTFSCVDGTVATFPFCKSAMSNQRRSHTATLLPNGQVLVAGGENGVSYLGTAELYTPTASTPPQRPVVIIPGIMGSNLDRSNDGIVWLDADTAAIDFLTGTDTSDSFLFSLLLQSDGISIDTNDYCTLSKTPCVNVGGSCLLGGTCVPGGTAIVPNGPIDISFLGHEVFRPYHDLANSLQARNYDVSIFPYDWRLDIASQVYPLRLFLDNLFAGQPSGQQVDVVAHSLGGLLMRAYLQKFPEDKRIHSVTYLGTPQAGAPIAYAKLMGSASLIDKFGANICVPNGLDLPLCLNLDTETFVSMHFPSVYQLLPRDPFISVNEGGTISPEPLSASFARLSEPTIARYNDLVSSQLLEEANNLYAAGLAGPNSVPRSFAINGTKHTTLVGIDFTDSGCPRGIPEFDSDGTVPHLSSATFLVPGANFYVDEEHGKLPANPSVAQQIANILSGNENSLASGITTLPLADADVWDYSSCSPILINVTDVLGRTNGLDNKGVLHEEIPDSLHLRFVSNEGGFLPFAAEYTLNIRPIANGMFTLILDHIASSTGKIVSSLRYADVPIASNSRGQLTIGPAQTNPSLLIDVYGDSTTNLTIAANTSVAPTAFVTVLIDIVRIFRLSAGIESSLLSKLNSALSSLKRGQVGAAQGQLTAFIDEVRAQTGISLTSDQANTLTHLATAALARL
jgi:pimeloyl-ACP methyl ester carboxylesterase